MLLSRSFFPARAAAFATAALVFTGSAFAQQSHVTPVAATAEPVTLGTDCNARSTNKEIYGDVKCEVVKGELISSQNACIAELLKFKTALPEQAREFAKVFGPVTRENACEAASRLPKPTASAAPRVGG